MRSLITRLDNPNRQGQVAEHFDDEIDLLSSDEKGKKMFCIQIGFDEYFRYLPPRWGEEGSSCSGSFQGGSGNQE